MYVGDETWSNYKVQVDLVDVYLPKCDLILMAHEIEKELHYVNISMGNDEISIRKDGALLPQGAIKNLTLPYTVSVTAHGDILTVFVNDEQVYQVTLPDFSYGFTGLACDYDNGFLDNFIVEPLFIE